jgi:hypothetical protein
MRRIDLGVFESADGTLDGGLDGEGRRDGNEIGDLVSFAAFLGPELRRHGGAERAAGVIKHWADSDVALLDEAKVIAHREHHEEAAEILRRAHDLAIA